MGWQVDGGMVRILRGLSNDEKSDCRQHIRLDQKLYTGIDTDYMIFLSNL